MGIEGPPQPPPPDAVKPPPAVVKPPRRKAPAAKARVVQPSADSTPASENGPEASNEPSIDPATVALQTIQEAVDPSLNSTVEAQLDTQAAEPLVDSAAPNPTVGTDASEPLKAPSAPDPTEITLRKDVSTEVRTEEATKLAEIALEAELARIQKAGGPKTEAEELLWSVKQINESHKPQKYGTKECPNGEPLKGKPLFINSTDGRGSPIKVEVISIESFDGNTFTLYGESNGMKSVFPISKEDLISAHMANEREKILSLFQGADEIMVDLYISGLEAVQTAQNAKGSALTAEEAMAARQKAIEKVDPETMDKQIIEAAEGRLITTDDLMRFVYKAIPKVETKNGATLTADQIKQNEAREKVIQEIEKVLAGGNLASPQIVADALMASGSSPDSFAKQATQAGAELAEAQNLLEQHPNNPQLKDRIKILKRQVKFNTEAAKLIEEDGLVKVFELMDKGDFPQAADVIQAIREGDINKMFEKFLPNLDEEEKKALMSGSLLATLFLILYKVGTGTIGSATGLGERR